jgi:hypothetical protein
MVGDDKVKELFFDGRKRFEPLTDPGHCAPPSSGPIQTPEVRTLDFIWADDVELDLDTPGLVDGLLGTFGMTVAYGESACGKTFAVVDLACHIAAQLPWRDMEVAGGIVVYIAAEAPKSVERRIWAWKAYHGVDHVPVLIVRSTVNLLSDDTAAVIALLAEIRAEHGRIALVVIDTLARAMVGNESSSEDMGAYVDACARIREAAATHVLSVHHSGKDTAKGARGWSGLRAATDVELEITKTDGVGSITISKNREERAGDVYGFRLEEIELGTNAKGRTITTCVAVSSEAPVSGLRRKPPASGHQKTVLDALTKAIAADGHAGPPIQEIPRTARGVSVERWQAEADRMLVDMDPKRRTETFKRASQALTSNGHVLHIQRFAWLPT